MAEADFELKYAHPGHRDTPKRKANREHLREMIADWQAEQEQKNVALAARATNSTRLEVAPRYAKGIARRREPWWRARCLSVSSVRVTSPPHAATQLAKLGGLLGLSPVAERNLGTFTPPDDDGNPYAG